MRTLLLRIVFAVYLVAMGFLVWLPNPDAVQYTGIVAVVARWFEPLGLPFEPTYIVLEILANVVLFVPFGLLLSVAAPRWSPWAIIGLGCLVSVVIELVQLGIPSRLPTVSDVIANSAGAALGCALVMRQRMLRTTPSAE